MMSPRPLLVDQVPPPPLLKYARTLLLYLSPLLRCLFFFSLWAHSHLFTNMPDCLPLKKEEARPIQRNSRGPCVSLQLGRRHFSAPAYESFGNGVAPGSPLVPVSSSQACGPPAPLRSSVFHLRPAGKCVLSPSASGWHLGVNDFLDLCLPAAVKEPLFGCVLTPRTLLVPSPPPGTSFLLSPPHDSTPGPTTTSSYCHSHPTPGRARAEPTPQKSCAQTGLPNRRPGV